MKRIIHIKAMIYGLYAVLCHICGVLLYYTLYKTELPHELLTRRCAEMLEYSLMSAVIVAVGALLIYYTTVKETRNGNE